VSSTDRRLRAHLGLVVAAAISIAAYAYSTPVPGGSPKTDRGLDHDALAVLPFRLTSGDPALADLRDALHDLLASRLRQLGAGQALVGEIGEANTARSVRAHIEGTADSLPQLADRLAILLLASHVARDSAELAGLSKTSLSALSAYLAGRHASRRGNLGAHAEAAEHFERALFLDSTFALAGLRVAEIAVQFGMAERDERWKLDAIWDLRDRLGAADRALLEAYLGPRYPRTATLAELIAAAERATLLAPHRSEAWHIAGVGYFRFGPRIGYPDWEERAWTAFGRALALDSSEVFTVQYSLLLAAVRGDSAAVRKYATLHRSYESYEGLQTDFIEWVSAIMLRDRAELVRLRARIPEMTSVSLQSIVEWSQSLGIGLEDADRAAHAFHQRSSSAAQRRTVVMRLVPFMLNRGRTEEASRLLAGAERGFGQAADVGVLEFRIYSALYWDGDSSEAASAARSLERYLSGEPARLGQVRDTQTANCALAHWRLARGDLAGAEMALAQLRRRGADVSYSVESIPVCAAAAEAKLAAARRRSDAAAALARLDALLAAGSDMQQLLPTIAVVVAAQLHEARGELQHALALTRRRTFWWNWLLSTPLREEGRLASLVGDTLGAVRAYRHYLALRSDAEPQLRPDVERVRAELARLERRAR
jgi:hypothetical protein